jgi:hypothetical protein
LALRRLAGFLRQRPCLVPDENGIERIEQAEPGSGSDR